MKFVCIIETLPGKVKEFVEKMKTAEEAEGIKIREQLILFGKPDAVIVFEAENETSAGRFILQFGEVATTKTLLSSEPEKFA